MNHIILAEVQSDMLNEDKLQLINTTINGEEYYTIRVSQDDDDQTLDAVFSKERAIAALESFLGKLRNVS